MIIDVVPFLLMPILLYFVYVVVVVVVVKAAYLDKNGGKIKALRQ